MLLSASLGASMLAGLFLVTSVWFFSGLEALYIFVSCLLKEKHAFFFCGHEALHGVCLPGHPL